MLAGGNNNCCPHCTTEGLQHPAGVCFHCQCTVCGAHSAASSQRRLLCAHCGSKTHAACARDAMDGTAVEAEGPAAPGSHFHCSPDCLLRVRLHANPNFDRRLSERVEHTARLRLAELNGGGGGGSSGNTSEGADDFTLQLAARAQVSYEAWREYFVAERLGSAHSTWFPPSPLALGDDMLGHITALVSAAGQAERCYLLDSAKHPVGSVVALPADVVWREYPRIKAGESNNFISESMDAILRTSVKSVVVAEVHI